jgi:hypothetical protein
MTKRLSVLGFIAVVATLGVTLLLAPTADALGHAQLKQLRHATENFKNLNHTLKSGRVNLHLCMDHMGEHFADPQTFSDGKLLPMNPEAMVYAHNPDGSLRLVAVEWVSTTPGTVLDIPLHFSPDVGLWILHAWIWQDNPSGMFADTNPTVGLCPAM